MSLIVRKNSRQSLNGTVFELMGAKVIDDTFYAC